MLKTNPSVYYRIYCANDSIPTEHPVSPEDPFLGRALALRIPPPYTAENISRFLLKYENLVSNFNTSEFFAHVYSESSCWNVTFVNLSDPVGLGSKPGDPVALVVSGTLDSVRSKA